MIDVNFSNNDFFAADLLSAKARDLIQKKMELAWDEGWDAGNFYAIDDFNRGPKAKNPYRSKP